MATLQLLLPGVDWGDHTHSRPAPASTGALRLGDDLRAHVTGTPCTCCDRPLGTADSHSCTTERRAA